MGPLRCQVTTCMEKHGRLLWHPKRHLDKILGPIVVRLYGGAAGPVLLLVHGLTSSECEGSSVNC